MCRDTARRDTGELFHDAHGCGVTLRADPQGRVGERFMVVAVVGGPGVGRRCRGHAQQGSAPCQLLLSMTIAEEAEVTDPLQAGGQDVKQEAANELVGGQRHGLLGRIGSVVLVAEGDLAVVDRDEPVVGDGDPVCVASDVVEDLARAGERGLGVDNPVGSPGGGRIAVKDSAIAKVREASDEPKCSWPVWNASWSASRNT